jgi:hypothetical protein
MKNCPEEVVTQITPPIVPILSATSPITAKPKIFAWCYQTRVELFAEIGNESWITLTEREAEVLESCVVDYVIKMLYSARAGRLFSRHEFTPAERRSLAKAEEIYPQKADIRRAAILTQKEVAERQFQLLNSEIGNVLQYHQDTYLRWIAAPFSIADIITREPYGALPLLDGLFQRWLRLTPAEKFFLIGGPAVLTWLNSPGIRESLVKPKRTLPKKITLRDAIFDVTIRGSLRAIPDILVTKGQIKTARKNCATIPERDLRERLFDRPRGVLSVYRSGLATKVSLRGRYQRIEKPSRQCLQTS